MTEQEFLALEPREQDALVAEKLFGWKILGVQRVYDDGYEDDLVGEPPGEPHDVVPYHTQLIAPAWQVVEKMEDEGWEWEVTMYGAEFFTQDDSGNVLGGQSEITRATVDAKTSLHICIAALKAKGVIE